MFEEPGVRLVVGAFLVLTVLAVIIAGAASWAMGGRGRVLAGISFFTALLGLWYVAAPSRFLWPL